MKKALREDDGERENGGGSNINNGWFHQYRDNQRHWVVCELSRCET